ncbi:hypothetical protein MA16_Dca017743 [Dendrobium catenatum]|uniref:Uncharacterized protein n=1 Tax=Dendrobium catenatum TaxID=906689 RepID=A0A2I0W6Q2_9ASPA|nr:hypothetical protein MA16_Dca017743 [Dendrobium catenatum]
MHGHGVNECFRFHPNLHKEKVSPKVLNGNDGHSVDVDNVAPNLMVEGMFLICRILWRIMLLK